MEETLRVRFVSPTWTVAPASSLSLPLPARLQLWTSTGETVETFVDIVARLTQHSKLSTFINFPASGALISLRHNLVTLVPVRGPIYCIEFHRKRHKVFFLGCCIYNFYIFGHCCRLCSLLTYSSDRIHLFCGFRICILYSLAV